MPPHPQNLQPAPQPMFATPPTFFRSGRESWDAMIQLCERATSSIDMEQFIFSDAGIGLHIAKLLIKKAQAGVRVRVLCDTVGSWDLYNSSLSKEMRDAGVDIRFVNIVGPWRVNNISSWFFRDHRKLLIIDADAPGAASAPGAAGFTGSGGVRDDMAHWRETNVLVTGNIVQEMLHSFTEMWERTGDTHMVSRISRSRKYVRGFQFISNAPYFRKRFLYHTIIDALKTAQSHIYLTTPYLVPDRRLMRTLRLAVKRGISVKIIVPKERFEVEPFVGSAIRSYYEPLLRAGIQIYEYNTSFMHAKTITIDGAWATAGSFNLDSLSFIYNYEANIVSTDPQFVGPLTTHFTEDLLHTDQILLSEWVKRPLYEKFLELLVMPFRRFM